MRLRPATWRDLAPVARLESVCFPQDPWSEATFWAELAERPHRAYWVATAPLGAGEPLDGPGSERVVGYAGLSTAGDVAEVMTVAVDPRERGSGLGDRLLGTLHEEAARAGAPAVVLEVRADNAPARSLYSTRGYAVVHTRRGYYRSTQGAPPVDAVVMRKELVPG